MKLIIDIPEDLYKATVNGLEADEIWDLRLAVKNGTPLDDVKAELAKPQKIDLGQLMSRSNVGIMRFGFEAYDKGVKHVIELLDNIGKESEDKNDRNCQSNRQTNSCVS